VKLAVESEQSMAQTARDLGVHENTLHTWIGKYHRAERQNVNIRLTHPKKSAAEHRVIIALGMIGQEAPATLDAGSDPVGQGHAERTPLAASGSRHGPSV